MKRIWKSRSGNALIPNDASHSMPCDCRPWAANPYAPSATICESRFRMANRKLGDFAIHGGHPRLGFDIHKIGVSLAHLLR